MNVSTYYAPPISSNFMYYAEDVVKKYNLNFDSTNYVVSKTKSESMPEIKDVKFNGPATIVFWSDGTKTVVKCSENETYDAEKAIMYAMLKKKLGNNSRVSKFFKKWVPETTNE